LATANVFAFLEASHNTRLLTGQLRQPESVADACPVLELVADASDAQSTGLLVGEI
jgi:hypothetical protein